MRFLLGIVVSFCLLGELRAVLPYSFWVNAGPIAFAPADRLWLKLDDGSGSVAADSSGSSNPGALNGSPTWVDGEDGIPLHAVNFNGITQDLTFTTAITLSTFTVSGWFNIGLHPGNPGVFIGNNTGSKNYLGIDGAGLNLVYYDGSLTTTCVMGCATGVWYNVVMTCNAGACQVWTNGVKAGSPFTVTGAQSFNCAGSDVANTRAANITADDIREYGQSLADAAVIDIHTQGAK